jgi:hypothetical protein
MTRTELAGRRRQKSLPAWRRLGTPAVLGMTSGRQPDASDMVAVTDCATRVVRNGSGYHHGFGPTNHAGTCNKGGNRSACF